jgi:hypothetical protein
LPHTELAAERGQWNDNPASETNRGQLSSLDRVIERGAADLAADHLQGLGDRDPERFRLGRVLLIHLVKPRIKRRCTRLAFRLCRDYIMECNTMRRTLQNGSPNPSRPADHYPPVEWHL